MVFNKHKQCELPATAEVRNFFTMILASKHVSLCLQDVSGGYIDERRTIMNCKDCQHSIEWRGDYRWMGPYKCPCCKQDEMYGTDTLYTPDD